jgi:4-carboxymuconolactone decarboxylase
MTPPALSAAQEALVSVSAALAARDHATLDGALRHAADVASPDEVEETILQSYLFLGYPTALNAFGRWRDITGRDAGPAVRDEDVWRSRGEQVCAAVYGGQYGGLRANIKRLHPDMERWMLEEGYGKVLGRPGLSLATRELCIAALLAVQDAPKQLYSHLRGALNVGASPEAVARAMELASALGTDEARAAADETWHAVLHRNQREA